MFASGAVTKVALPVSSVTGAPMRAAREIQQARYARVGYEFDVAAAAPRATIWLSPRPTLLAVEGSDAGPAVAPTHLNVNAINKIHAKGIFMMAPSLSVLAGAGI